jgi:hypothetical protein
MPVGSKAHVDIVYTYSPYLKGKQHFSIKKISWLMLFWEISCLF